MQHPTLVERSTGLKEKKTVFHTKIPLTKRLSDSSSSVVICKEALILKKDQI